MIVFVKITPRRYIALDTQKYESAWRNVAPGMNPPIRPTSEGLIYASGTLIAKGDWTTVERAAVAYAQQYTPEKILTYEVWETQQLARQARVRELNRGLGLGAVLSRPKGDEAP